MKKLLCNVLIMFLIRVPLSFLSNIRKLMLFKNTYGCKQKSFPLGRSAVHLVPRVRSLDVSFVRFHRRALGGPFVR